MRAGREPVEAREREAGGTRERERRHLTGREERERRRERAAVRPTRHRAHVYVAGHRAQDERHRVCGPRRVLLLLLPRGVSARARA